MRAKLHVDIHSEGPVRTARIKGMMVGLVGGLLGTILMDLSASVLGVARRTPPVSSPRLSRRRTG
jgi:hypothetical protein